jgi:transaldolase
MKPEDVIWVENKDDSSHISYKVAMKAKGMSKAYASRSTSERQLTEEEFNSISYAYQQGWQKGIEELRKLVAEYHNRNIRSTVVVEGSLSDINKLMDQIGRDSNTISLKIISEGVETKEKTDD